MPGATKIRGQVVWDTVTVLNSARRFCLRDPHARPKLRVSISEVGGPSTFSELLHRVDGARNLSVWSGPALATDAQPIIVGDGIALAIVATEEGSYGLAHPTFKILSRALLPNPRPENPGIVQNQPHMQVAGQDWLAVIAEASVEGGQEFFARTGIHAPLGLMSFGFAPGTPGALVLPRIAWVALGDTTWKIETAIEADGEDFHAIEDSGGQRDTAHEDSGGAPNWYLDPGTMSRSAWKHAVTMVVDELRGGRAQKAVMARDITARSDHPINLVAVLQELATAYPTTWTFSVAGLTGASPEMLASVRGGQLKSRVLAGTCPPGEGAALWESAKDREEHALAVQSVVDSLAGLSRDLNAPRQPFLLDLPNVTHLATDVTADFTAIEVGHAPVCEAVRALHPTAAVCGTPTQDAFELLSKHELTDRGRYSGPVGWIDGAGEGACAIALRCGQVLPDEHSIRVFAGGGIMPESIPEVELAETGAKILPVLQAIGLEN